MTARAEAIPAVTADQMREVDRLMVDTYGVSLPQMMELAGRALAEVVRLMLDGTVQRARVLVAAGKGNNGGGGLAAARHLANWGTDVTVLLEDGGALAGVPEQQYLAARSAGAAAVEGRGALTVVRSGAADLLVDALIGLGLRGAPKGWAAEIIARINESGIPVLALDVPSGLDATSGECFPPCIQAAATLTLALPKTGLLTARGRAAAGRLYLADIGVPPALYRHLGLTVGPVFAQETIVSLDPQGGHLASRDA